MATSKKPTLDPETVRIARALLSAPPKPHDEMKVGKPNAKRERKNRARSANKKTGASLKTK